MSAQSDQAKGHAKEAAGLLTGNEDLQAEGKAERVAGETQERTDKVKDKVEGGLDKVQHALNDVAGQGQEGSSTLVVERTVGPSPGSTGLDVQHLSGSESPGVSSEPARQAAIRWPRGLDAMNPSNGKPGTTHSTPSQEDGVRPVDHGGRSC